MPAIRAAGVTIREAAGIPKQERKHGPRRKSSFRAALAGMISNHHVRTFSKLLVSLQWPVKGVLYVFMEIPRNHFDLYVLQASLKIRRGRTG